MSDQPCLLVLEGPDGVGKSALCRSVCQVLNRMDRRTETFAFPGNRSGTLGELVYQVHHAPENFGVTRLHPASLQTLHVAAHVDAVENQVKPALANGVSVILDRFWWSTLVYGLDSKVDRNFLETIIAAEKLFWGSLVPDYLFLIERDAPIGATNAMAEWLRIKRRYEEVAIAEGREYEVVRISNHGTLEAATDKIVQKAVRTCWHAN